MIIWDFLTFYPVLLSPKVKRSAFINNKNAIYGMSHEFSNNLRQRILES